MMHRRIDTASAHDAGLFGARFDGYAFSYAWAWRFS
jgi:hypothetical protein